jgi:hypothetical protein
LTTRSYLASLAKNTSEKAMELLTKDAAIDKMKLVEETEQPSWYKFQEASSQLGRSCPHYRYKSWD